MRLPEQPWRTTRLANGHVTRLYYEPAADAPQSEVVSVTRDADGVLMRHATCQYTYKRMHGKLVDVCLSPTGAELCALLRFDGTPEGSLLRVQTMSLSPRQPGTTNPPQETT